MHFLLRSCIMKTWNRGRLKKETWSEGPWNPQHKSNKVPGRFQHGFQQGLRKVAGSTKVSGGSQHNSNRQVPGRFQHSYNKFPTSSNKVPGIPARSRAVPVFRPTPPPPQSWKTQQVRCWEISGEYVPVMRTRCQNHWVMNSAWIFMMFYRQHHSHTTSLFTHFLRRNNSLHAQAFTHTLTHAFYTQAQTFYMHRLLHLLCHTLVHT